MTEIETLLEEIESASKEAFKKSKDKDNEIISERLFMAKLSYSLQKNENDIIAINECPYDKGTSEDQFADMYIEMNGLKVWFEFKPFQTWSNYWNKSKTFKNKTHIALSDSPVLNDIDKVWNIGNSDYFIFAIMYSKKEGRKVKFKEEIKPLIKERFEYNLEKKTYTIKEVDINEHYSLIMFYV